MENPIDVFATCLEPWQREEIEKGAYVRVSDPKKIFYNMCARWDDEHSYGGVMGLYAEPVKSSHQSLLPQIRMRMDDKAEILVGHVQDHHNNNFTFFQKERYAAASVFEHVMTFLGYEFTGMDVGPRGMSKFTERNPLTVVKHIFE